MELAIGTIFAALMLCSLAYRGYWRCFKVFALVQVVQFLQIPFLLWPTDPLTAYHRWFLVDKLNILLNLLAFGSVVCTLPLVGYLVLLQALLEIWPYVSIDKDWQYNTSWLHWLNFAVGLCIYILVIRKALLPNPVIPPIPPPPTPPNPDTKPKPKV